MSDTLARLLAEATARNEARNGNKTLARMLAKAMVDPEGFLSEEDEAPRRLPEPKQTVFPSGPVRA